MVDTINLDMIEQVSTEIVAATVVIAAIITIFIFFFPNRKGNVAIPRAKGWPILGNALDFSPKNMLQTGLDYPRKYGKYVEFYLINVRAVLITDAEVAKELCSKRPKKFRRIRSFDYGTQKLKLDSGLFHSNGKIWSKIRKLTSPSFSSINIQKKFHFVIKDMIEWSKVLRDRCQKGKVIDFREEILLLTVRVITTVAFNLPEDHPVNDYFLSSTFVKDVNQLLKFSIEHIMFPFPRFLWKYSPMYQYEVDAAESNARFIGKCREVLDYKKKIFYANNNETSQGVVKQGMIDNFLALSIDHKDEFDETELIANVETIYLAGSETTQISICWSIYFLMKNPDMLQKVRDEVERVLFPDASHHPWNENNVDSEDYSTHYNLETINQKLTYTNNVVQEILRLCGPASALGFNLEEREEFTLPNGIVLGPDDEAWINIDGIHYDPEVFPNPEQFNPDRWDKNHTDEAHLKKMYDHILTFGYGPRLCPGMFLAKYEAVAAVAIIIYLFDLEIAGSFDDVKRVMIFTATLNQLKIKVTPRVFPSLPN